MNRAQSKQSHNIYVVELDRRVWSESKKFREANTHYKGKSDCVYVGMTSHSPKERYLKHKTGARSKKGFKLSSRFVEKYGICLRPSLYEGFNPMSKERAVRMERELANSLKKRGFAVWWN